MKKEKIDLSLYDNSWYDPGATKFKIFLWYFVNVLFFLNPLNPFSGIKVFFLRFFGAKIGNNVIIKPRVNIKYPWLLSVGDYTWIGECVWIDNLAKVNIGNNVCLSQGVTIICGNHNYKKKSFDLIVSPIIIEDGVWICAKSVILPGTVMRENSVSCSGNIVSGNVGFNCILIKNKSYVCVKREIV